MAKVVHQLKLGKTISLALDEDRPTNYNGFTIDGKTYKSHCVYDTKKAIAIEAVGNFVGKDVLFF